MGETVEFSITRASQLTIPNLDWTHYRSGLKIRCTNGSLGVTLAVISQGKSIDTTMITASNVKFLSKEPTVGLKIFDGEKLRKRLQITFTNEGNFNIFVNKINQWIGVDVVSKYENSKSHAAKSQSASQGSPLSQVVEISSSQTNVEHFTHQGERSVSSPACNSTGVPSRSFQESAPELPVSPWLYSHDRQAQFVVPEITQQLNPSTTNPFRNYGDVNTAESPRAGLVGDTSHNGNRLSLLLSAAAVEKQREHRHDDSSFLSHTVPTRSTPIREELQYTETSAIDTSLDNRRDSVDLSQALRKLPFNPTKHNKKKPHTSHSNKRHGTNELFESTIQSILEKKKERLLDMGDDELALKTARKLKSKSFLMLLKRVENILG